MHHIIPIPESEFQMATAMQVYEDERYKLHCSKPFCVQDPLLQYYYLVSLTIRTEAMDKFGCAFCI